MPRLPDVAATIATLRRIASAPTAPYHESQALAAIAAELTRIGIATQTDAYGQLFARLVRGRPKRALAFVAHADHPAFEITSADGAEGRVRVVGGLSARCFAGQQVAVIVHDDLGGEPFPAVVDDYRPDPDFVLNSPGHCRVRSKRKLWAGQWAVLDLPACEVAGDELKLGAADDLAGCALILLALEALVGEQRAFNVHAMFTRAEEPGLYGARLIAEDGSLPRDTYVVSVEASRALADAAPGRGIVVRAGDHDNTFSNEAEIYLRVAQERLADEGIATQRALLTGGTCEASAFVRLGFVATGIALPNVNYHNASPEDRFASEIIRVSDLRSGVALLAEAAVAAGEDASERWWPLVRSVPSAVRARLRGRS